MRKFIGFVLTLLGAFLIAAAALLRFWLAPVHADQVKYPLNEYEVIHLSGSGSYFSESHGEEETGVSVEVTYTQKGDVARGSGSTAVWDLFSYVYDLTDHEPISYQSSREAISRTTGELVNCCGAFAGSTAAGKPDTAPMSGLGLFPMGARQTTYLYYDGTAKKAEPARFSGTALVDGITVYKYVEKVSPTRISTVDVPGSIIGDPLTAEVPLGEYYSTTNAYYVDPETGATLDVAESPTVTLGNSPSNVEILASQISVVETAPSIASSVSQDQHARGQLTLYKITLPLVSLLAGILLLAAGIILLWRGTASEYSGDRGRQWSPPSGAGADYPGWEGRYGHGEAG